MNNQEFDFKDYLTKYFGSETFLTWWETPAVLYSAKKLHENIDNLKSLLNFYFRHSKVYYAIKACMFFQILFEMKSRNVGVEVQSIEELDTVCAAGFSSLNIICNGLGKSNSYMDRAIREGHILIADSISEWKYILENSSSYSINERVGFRINPGDIIKSRFAFESKLGMDLFDAVVALQDASERGIRIVLHFHALSRAKSISDIDFVIAPIVTWLRSLSNNCLNVIAAINIGGGLDSPLNFYRNGLSVNNCISHISSVFGDLLINRILLIECGRYFVEDTAVGLATVLEKKQVQGKNWLIVDMGTNLLIPIPSSDFLVVEPYSQKVKANFGIADRICSPAAVILRNVELPDLSKGDRLFILNVGSYTYTLGESFGFRIPDATYLNYSECYSLINKSSSLLLWDILSVQCFNSTKNLSTPNLLVVDFDLILRPFRTLDAQDVAEGLADREMSRFTERIPWPYSINDAHEWIASIDELSRSGSLILAVENISLRKVIGAVETRVKSDFVSAEIMYWVAKDFQGNHVGKRAIAKVVKLLFDSYKVSSIFARVSPENKPSKCILEGLGFIKQEELQSGLLHYIAFAPN